MRPLLDDGRFLASACGDMDPLLHKHHRVSVGSVEPLLLDAGDRRHRTGIVSRLERSTRLGVPPHRARGPHTPRKRLRGTEIRVGPVWAECVLGMVGVEEGEVMAIREGGALRGGTVWVACVGTVARRESDVEVGEVGWGEGVGE